MSSLLSDTGLRSAEGGVGPADERPLTDQERKVVTRLLSDPFAFPQSFKTWLIAFLEGSSLSLPLSSVVGLSAMLGVQSGGSAGIFGLLPAGMIFPFAGAYAPEGTLLCNGAAYAREGQYKRLYDAIGTTWGAPSGTTFSVPDLQNRVPVFAGPGYPVGATDGLIPTQRGPRHHHGLNNHSHGMSHVHSLSNHSHGMGHSHSEVGVSGSSMYAMQGNDWVIYVPAGTNTGGPSFSNTSGPTTDQTGGPNFTTTSGSTGDTTGGGPADTPSYGCVGAIINY